MFNPVVQGWMNYFASFYKAALYPTLRQVDYYLARWAERKYKKLHGHLGRARHWLARVAQSRRGLFAHWKLVQPTAG
jgi:RNA-directed DNA polymerase